MVSKPPPGRPDVVVQLTGVRSHVALQQAGPVERLAAHLARQQGAFAALRTGFRRRTRQTGDGLVVQVAGAAGGRRRRGGRLAGHGLVLVLGAGWRGDGQHDARQQRHGQIEGRFWMEGMARKKNDIITDYSREVCVYVLGMYNPSCMIRLWACCCFGSVIGLW